MADLRTTTFSGEPAVEIVTSQLRLAIVTARGPRIAFFGKPTGDNLLLWQPGKYKRGQWDLMGGHRLWIARPGADEAEETYVTDNAACTVEKLPDGFRVTGATDPQFRVTRGITVRVLAEDRVQIEHFARNESDMLFSGGLWALTCTVPGKGATYHIPLGDGSNWDTATVVLFRTWAGHGNGDFNDPQFSTTKDSFVLTPGGRENKRMIRADAGVLAMHDPSRGILFAKHAAYQPEGVYPLGTNLAVYVGPDNFMVEMETMGANASLKTGQSARHTETWVLRTAGTTSPATSELRQLFA